MSKHRVPTKTIAGFLALAFASAGVSAEDVYPSRPVRIVVSFAAGGPTDAVARILGAKLGELFGQQFLVENKTGAGGNIGADLVAKAAPDGYTLLMATVSTHAINPGLYKKMPYDPIRDFAPIGEVGVTPIMSHARYQCPARIRTRYETMAARRLRAAPPMMFVILRRSKENAYRPESYSQSGD